VVCCERDKLTSGHHVACGRGEFVAAVLGADGECDLLPHGRNFIAGLATETGQATGWREVGYIQAQPTPDGWRKCRRGAAS